MTVRYHNEGFNKNFFNYYDIELIMLQSIPLNLSKTLPLFRIFFQ